MLRFNLKKCLHALSARLRGAGFSRCSRSSLVTQIDQLLGHILESHFINRKESGFRLFACFLFFCFPGDFTGHNFIPFSCDPVTLEEAGRHLGETPGEGAGRDRVAAATWSCGPLSSAQLRCRAWLALELGSGAEMLSGIEPRGLAW